MTKLQSILLILILVISFVARAWDLKNLPPALNWDEVSHGYNAYSILKTGLDEWGELPIANFRAYGDYPLPVNMYLLIPFISIFGLNEIAIRIPGAIFGTLLVLVIYLLAKQITKDSKTAFVSALLTAVSPWTILTSRQVLQATPAVLFFTSGILFFLKGEKNWKWSILGTICLGISAYTYHNTRILAPIIFMILIFLYRENILKFKNRLVIQVLTATIFFLPLFFIITLEQGAARAVWVGIINEGSINQINESRGRSNLTDPIPTLLYNKVTYFTFKSTQNYLGYFGPTFLGIEGGTHYQFSIPHLGVIYPLQLPFFYLGLFFLILNFRKNYKVLKFLTLLLLISPLPAAITSDPYQVVRSTTMIPAVFITSAIGFGLFYDLLKDRVKTKFGLISLFSILLIIFFVHYLFNLWFVYRNQYSFAWQYGYQLAVDYIKDQGNNYENIYMTKKYGEPHEFLLFYLSYDPDKYKNDPNLVRYQRSDWFWVDQFDKYHFVNDWEVKEKMENIHNSLLITSPGNYPTRGELLKTIYFLDNTPSFDIVKLP